MEIPVSSIQWWCSARGTPWDWSWQAYPGVWIFVLVVAVSGWRARRRAAASRDAGARVTREWWRSASLITGVVLMWLMLDWPVGPLGTGYLAVLHALQFVVLAMMVPPLLLAGYGPEAARAALERPVIGAVLRVATQPFLAMNAYVLVMVLTHVPSIVDSLMGFQLGAFALDLSWLLSGLAFWWSVVLPSAERRHFGPPMRMLYVFFGTQAHLYIAMWLLLADFPRFATYELAPRVSAIDAIADQQLAGGVMLGIGSPLVLAIVGVIFFRWFAESEQADARV